MTAYYNEIDPAAAQWLRNLIDAGHIAPGHVDQRSIEDVTPNDLRGFAQCHFFAGIGVWSYALRRAGWPDDRSVWTGSCPCQPFSAAGKGDGFADERHLWPAFNHLIAQCKPPVVIGEQVAAKAVEPWIDLVHADLEALGYAFGAVPFPSASVGAPHIRDRLYWVADTNSGRQQRQREMGRPCYSEKSKDWEVNRTIYDGRACGMGHTHSVGAGWDGRCVCGKVDCQHREYSANNADASSGVGRMANTKGQGWSHGRSGNAFSEPTTIDGDYYVAMSGPTNGFWRDADWLLCRDGKWRPVEPGTSPLANGAPSRVVRLRAYGNAINAIQAQIFIESLMP